MADSMPSIPWDRKWYYIRQLALYVLCQACLGSVNGKEITWGNSATKKSTKMMANSFVVLSVLLLLEYCLEADISELDPALMFWEFLST